MPGHFDGLPANPPDELFALEAEFEHDRRDLAHKVDAGIGEYRGSDGTPHVLSTVRAVRERLVLAPPPGQLHHEYLPIEGLSALNTAAERLLLGDESSARGEGRVTTVQCAGGTGALRLGAEVLRRVLPASDVCLLPRPTWETHKPLFHVSGFNLAHYAYYDDVSCRLDLDGMVRDIEAAPRGSVVVLHACAHNPTGLDPPRDTWERIADAVAARDHVPFFDVAYLAFATGNVELDAWPVRMFVDRGFDVLAAMSFSKNMGLYGERVGALVAVTAPGTMAQRDARAIHSQLQRIQRAQISTPPAFGARIAAAVLNDAGLSKQWMDDVHTMRDRILAMRRALAAALEARGTPGKWQHITEQIGLFWYSGFTVEQCHALHDRFHVYVPESGRVNISGLTKDNVEYFADAVDWVARNINAKVEE